MKDQFYPARKALRLFFLTLCSALGGYGLAIDVVNLEAVALPVATNQPNLLTELRQSSREALNENLVPMGEIAQSRQGFADIPTNHWAANAVRSLADKYQCLSGNERGLFEGTRLLNRFEFVAALNSCLTRLEQLRTERPDLNLSANQWETIQKLQTEFRLELQTVRQKIAALEVRADRVQSQAFSNTTKLEGQGIIAFSGGSGGRSALVSPNGTATTSQGQVNTTALARVRLNLYSTFTGSDLLHTRLELGNNGSMLPDGLDNGGDMFRGFMGFGNASTADYSQVSSGVNLGRLRYDFPLSSNVKVGIGTLIGLNDHLDKNSFANDESADFSTRMFINNPLTLPLNEGAGTIIDWKLSDTPFNLRFGYVAARAASATRGNSSNGVINQGLFGDNYQGTVELSFTPMFTTTSGETKGNFSASLQYTRATVNNLDYNTGGLNLEWALHQKLALFGRYGIGTLSNRGVAISNALPTYINGGFTGDSISPQTWSAGLVLLDFGKEGATAGLGIGQPLIEGKVGNSTQTNLELYYKLPLSNNISLTPDLLFIFNPNNNSNNGTMTVGTLRTVFTF
ncbi:MAG: iron uptake porin [Pseudanabaena sp. ELA607]